MQTLGLNVDSEETAECEGRFWRRQFQQEPTGSQKRFDWIFGVILPVICFALDPIVFTLDPIVFKGDAWGAAFLGGYKPFSYILSFVSIMAMMAWLIWGARLGWLNAPLSGLFVVGGIVSLGIGIVMIPISLLGLIILIGALGFTALCSAVVYLRNGVRAFRTAKPIYPKNLLFYSVALTAIFSAVVPFVVNVEIQHSIETIKNSNVEGITAETRKLRYLSPLVNFDTLAVHYYRSSDGEKTTPEMEAISIFYEEMTGRKMDDSVWVMMD